MSMGTSKNDNQPQLPEKKLVGDGEKIATIAQMRLAGFNWGEVASETGFADGSGAWRFWHRYMQDSIQASLSEYRLLNTERLERLLRAVWVKALGGSVTHVDKARAIIADLRKLHGLDMPERYEVQAIAEPDPDVTEAIQNLTREEQDLLTRVLFPTPKSRY